jgi:hypothetical protein
MDDRRFDLLVKSIGRSTSRRTLLRGMLGIAATAAGVTALRQDETDAARRGFSGLTFPTPLPACGANRTRCGTGCVDTLSDPTNCGGCGNTCDTSTSTCTGGSCVERCAGGNCTGLDTYCTVGVCDPATGTCAAEVANENGACTTGGSAAGTCTTGTCVANPVTCPECWHEENGQCVLDAPVNNCACCFTNVGGVCVPDPPVDHDGDGCLCGYYNVGGICVPNPPQP